MYINFEESLRLRIDNKIFSDLYRISDSVQSKKSLYEIIVIFIAKINVEFDDVILFIPQLS